MKKSILMLGLAVAAMTSCTNDEVVEVNQSTQKAIGFETFVNKGTRVAVTNEVTEGTLQRFYVYGYHNGTDPVTTVFNNVSVINNNGWKMEAQYEKYWETQSYNFAAYADGPGAASHAPSTLETSFAGATLSFTDYAVSEEQANQTDLIAAVAERDNRSTLNVTAVDLDFKHLLSKVNFKFSNTNTNNLSMVVSNVTFTVYRQANCSYNGSATWSGWETAQSYDIAQPCKGTSVDDIVLRIDENTTETIKAKYLIARGEESDISIEYFVIPKQENDNTQSPTVGIISYTVAYYDAEYNQVETYTQSLSLFPNTLKWQPSYIYNYDVELPASPKKIEFSVKSIGSWEAQEVTLDGANQ